MYGVGKNEELLGRAISEHRDQLIIATKFGNVRGAKGEFLGVNERPEYVKQACEASLKRIGVERIDSWGCRKPLLQPSKVHPIAALTN
jgi:aryl-alcohol dehydrogenase-like predicted oxidoreductase